MIKECLWTNWYNWQSIDHSDLYDGTDPGYTCYRENGNYTYFVSVFYDFDEYRYSVGYKLAGKSYYTNPCKCSICDFNAYLEFIGGRN